MPNSQFRGSADVVGRHLHSRQTFGLRVSINRACPHGRACVTARGIAGGEPCPPAIGFQFAALTTGLCGSHPQRRVAPPAAPLPTCVKLFIDDFRGSVTDLRSTVMNSWLLY